MAISKILHMKQAKSGYPAKHLANGLQYIMAPEKTGGGRYISGSGCIPETALAQMLETKRHFGKKDKRQAYHFIISFEKGEVTEETAFQVLGRFVEEYLGADYEAVYAVHNDTDHIHGHMIFNSVRCTDGSKYDYPKGEWEHRIQPLVNRLCREHGLSTLDMEEVKKKRRQRKDGEGEEKERKKNLSESRCHSQNEPEGRELREAELFYIYIPYRNRHLTWHQRECFLRKYRAGKVRKNPKGQGYQASCQALKRLQEEYLFWSEHGILTKADICKEAEKAEEQLRNIRIRKKKLAEEKKQYQAVFSLLDALKGCEMEAGLFQKGYPEFAGAYQEYQEICGQMEAIGFPVNEARKLEMYFQAETCNQEKARKEALKKKRIARRLEAKASRQDWCWNQKESDQKESNQKKTNQKERNDKTAAGQGRINKGHPKRK